jgi:hypothetical protein
MLFISNSEFFDSSGNTYFSANVYLNSDLVMKIPYQYGYSEHCRQVFTKAACEHFGIENSNLALRELLSKNGIALSVQTKNVKKRDLSKSSFQDFSAFTKTENLALYAHHRMQQGIELKHHTMENVFIDWLTPDAIGVTFADGSNELLPFSAFDWF